MDGGLSVTCYERYEHICGLGMTGRKDLGCDHVRKGSTCPVINKNIFLNLYGKRITLRSKWKKDL